MTRIRLSADRGVSLTEFAILLPMLLLIALGAFEYGMLFRDSLTVSTAAREAGRVAASSANYGDADCVILEAAAGALQSLGTGELDEVHIYKSDASGAIPLTNAPTMRRYSPHEIGDPPPLTCTSGSEWTVEHLGGAWDPDDRVNDPSNADWIGVRVQYHHTWLTDFAIWSGTAPLEDDAVFRIEPPAPSAP